MYMAAGAERHSDWLRLRLTNQSQEILLGHSVLRSSESSMTQLRRIARSISNNLFLPPAKLCRISYLVSYAAADLRSGHLCSGRRGPCHMVLGGPRWKSITKFALQLLKQDFYFFKLCTVDKVYAVRLVDNNNDMPFPSQKFNSLNVWVAAKTNKKLISRCDSERELFTTTS